MVKSVCVRVPASTANLGPGFDCLGIALNLYNEIYMEIKGHKLEIDVEGEGILNIERNEENLIYKAAKKIFDKANISVDGLYIKSKNGIPTGSGLGSSAAAIIGGLVAANALIGSPVSRDEILDIASSMEGHADNVSPALNGGFNVATFDGKKTYFVKKELDDHIAFLAFYPKRELLTSKARGVLPSIIEFRSAVFNVGRSSLFTASIFSGRYDLLKYASQDMLHQVYRKEFIKEMYYVIEEALDKGAYAAFLSGAGPTMMAMVDKSALSHVEEAIKKVYEDRGIECSVYKLKCDNDGATII
ncbi:Homoserine kinase [Thermoanaerobacterium xylanolyticum LX-11]|uniref:Homoserine kinase n=1 Tax=Thermoanaerobacterium xylanolyticum (strain ATCC 49914 / DSM 7097 / LX-11) TaxID=858215 RepID=F6BLR2_THEXL|nr:homoserine kinase [Thermoanaerobacterium xylanolyticum]AEF18263.1 Homoserine kinase [Thermoanaerobacterium xylanolyticum LX-11]